MRRHKNQRARVKPCGPVRRFNAGCMLIQRSRAGYVQMQSVFKKYDVLDLAIAKHIYV